MRTAAAETRRAVATLTALALTLSTAAGLRAGGALETIDMTGSRPSPVAGHLLARVTGVRWDSRTIPVRYRMNSTLDPVPNPLGMPVLTLAEATAALQASFDDWNAIPTSYIEMKIEGAVVNANAVGFDFVNELSFRTTANFGAMASSASISLIEDATFADGDDVDGDGDSDVSAALSSAADVDGDGDVEFPAGFYKAGTILDNDVQFNARPASGFRFTVGEAAIDDNPLSVDLNTVATHEFGHSHGLSHSMDNQLSDTDGDSATMFPFIDTGDPDAERAQRSLEMDDVAWSSFFYPEGSARRGPAALQRGDVPFDRAFGLLTGTVRHGVLDQPLAGASLFAVDWSTRRVVASGFSGRAQLSFDPRTGTLAALEDPGLGILSGDYVVPLPPGIYRVGIEAVDGQPAAAGHISFTAQIGAFYGQQNFNEEFFDRLEGSGERSPGVGVPVAVSAGAIRRGIDFVTARAINVSNFGNRNFVGFTQVVPGQYYAVRVPASQLAMLARRGPLLLHSALFNTAVLDSSVVPVFAEATLTTGTVHADGNTATLDLANPLARDLAFVGQDDDDSPFYFRDPVRLGRRVQEGIADGSIHDLFMVLRIPTATPFPGASRVPPLIGLDGGVAVNDGPIYGLSYVSRDGATFTRVTNFNFMFSLVVGEQPASRR